MRSNRVKTDCLDTLVIPISTVSIQQRAARKANKRYMKLAHVQYLFEIV